MSTRTRSRNAFETQLNGGITAGATTITVDSSTGLTHPCYVVIDPDSPTKREFIRVGNISGTTWSGITRGLDGSAAGAQAHDTGTPVRAVPVHQHLDDIFTDIEAVEADQHTQVHDIEGADHTATGLTTGHVLRATGATTFAFGQAQHADIGGVSADQHHNQQHVIDGPDHTASGLTVGHVLRASGASTFAFAQLQFSDLGGSLAHSSLSGITTDDHHNENHQARHQSGGADALTGLLDATARVSVSKNSLPDVGARRTLNFVEGSNITLTIADDAAGEEVDITIAASGVTDHGALTGLGDDDHSIYVKADGTRNITGTQRFTAASAVIFGGAGDSQMRFTEGAELWDIEMAGAANSFVKRLRFADADSTAAFDIIFYDGDGTTESLRWDESDNQWEFNKDIHLNANVTVEDNANDEILPGTLTVAAATLRATTTDPTMGTGSTSEIRWMRVGNLVHCWYTFTFGSSGAAAGSGNYYVWPPSDGAPAVASNWGATAGDRSVVGNFEAADDSAGTVGHHTGAVRYEPDVSPIRMVFIAQNEVTFAHNQPFTWANNDYIWIHVVYPTD